MALPATLNPVRPVGNNAADDPASTLDNQVRDLKQLIADLFGIPVDPTSLTAAWFSGTAAGVVTVAQQLVSPTITGAAPAVPIANRLYTDSIVKGWVKFQVNGTIDDDLNVVSITDNAPGDWTVVWETDFANIDYCVLCVAQADATTGAGTFGPVVDDDNSPAVGTTRINYAADGALADPAGATVRLFVLAIGDQ